MGTGIVKISVFTRQIPGMKRIALKTLSVLLKTFVALVIIIALMLWGNQ